MTHRNSFTEPADEPRACSACSTRDAREAARYEEDLQGTERLHNRQPADLLRELRDETRNRADRAENLLAQRLANGGVQ